jgi:hypothetical protein
MVAEIEVVPGVSALNVPAEPPAELTLAMAEFDEDQLTPAVTSSECPSL